MTETEAKRLVEELVQSAMTAAAAFRMPSNVAVAVYQKLERTKADIVLLLTGHKP